MDRRSFIKVSGAAAAGLAVSGCAPKLSGDGKAGHFSLMQISSATDTIGESYLMKTTGGKVIMVDGGFASDVPVQWKRLETNPLVEPTEGYFDASACYKPSVFRDEENNRWQLWYNGRNEGVEYIGYAIHEGLEL